MNARIVVLTSALAAACGGSDMRPAQDPASATTTVAPSEQNGTATDTAATTPGNGQSASTGVTNRTPDSNAVVSPAVVAPSPGAPAVDNPGVADHTKNADNTKINDRDRHGALTPMNQGNSGAETKITAAIRKGIMSDKTLSFTAKNVKVITVGNRVTLRGPVKSDQEKAAIEALAKQADGVAEVDDQLEVKK